MNKYEIIKKIEDFAPVETAESWDASGWIVETKKQEISKIMLSLTPVENIIRQAVYQNCDMIISHHPMFYINLDSYNFTNNFTPKIDIYCAHTNLDKANGGTTDTIISTLGLDDKKIKIEHEFLRFVEFKNGILVNEFSKLLSKISPNARIINNKSIKSLKIAAFCAGSGSEFIKEAQTLGADCLVTGDLKFHTALDSEIVVYDIGHFESEILILPKIKQIIGDEVEIVYAKEESPFKNITNA